MTGTDFYSDSFLCHYPQPLSTDPMTLEVSYSPVSVGQLRLWLSFGESMKSMTALGQSVTAAQEVLYVALLLRALSRSNLPSQK